MAAIGRGDLSGYDMLKAMGHTIDDTKLKELRRKSREAMNRQAVNASGSPSRGHWCVVRR